MSVFLFHFLSENSRFKLVFLHFLTKIRNYLRSPSSAVDDRRKMVDPTLSWNDPLSRKPTGLGSSGMGLNSPNLTPRGADSNQVHRPLGSIFRSNNQTSSQSPHFPIDLGEKINQITFTQLNSILNEK